MGGSWGGCWVNRVLSIVGGGAVQHRKYSSSRASKHLPSSLPAPHLTDGKQWALGAEGMAGIPESHRQEVQDMLTAQFNFFAQALGKTVFQRETTRGGRRR